MVGERTAVVDIGTNSTRLLVAELEDGSLRELERRSEVTRLGEGVDATGRLADAAMARVRSTLAEFRDVIDHHGATHVIGVATSAMRDASNGPAFREEVERRFGIAARTISGDEEARLTFLGATSARPQAERDANTLVIDIGGGSTELVVGRPGAGPSFHVSTGMGSVRHTERYLRDDPPTPHQLDELRADVRRIAEREAPPKVRSQVNAGIAVAGTATSLAAIDQSLEPYDAARVHGYPLPAEAVARMLKELASMPLERRRRVAGLHPDRAPTIVAGAAILLETMGAFGLPAVEISEADILHGAALAAGELAGGAG